MAPLSLRSRISFGAEIEIRETAKKSKFSDCKISKIEFKSNSKIGKYDQL